MVKVAWACFVFNSDGGVLYDLQLMQFQCGERKMVDGPDVLHPIFRAFPWEAEDEVPGSGDVSFCQCLYRLQGAGDPMSPVDALQRLLVQAFNADLHT